MSLFHRLHYSNSGLHLHSQSHKHTDCQRSQGAQEAWFIAIIVGVLAFIVVAVFKLVDVLFALSTSSQGASLITMALFAVFTATPVGVLQGFHGVQQGAVLWPWVLVWLGITAVGFVFQLRSRKHAEV